MHDLGADQGLRLFARYCREIGEQFLRYGDEMALMALRARQDQRIRWGSQLEIRPVEFEPSGAATRQPEITDDLVLDPVKDPRGTRVCRAQHAAVIRSLEQP